MAANCSAIGRIVFSTRASRAAVGSIISWAINWPGQDGTPSAKRLNITWWIKACRRCAGGSIRTPAGGQGVFLPGPGMRVFHDRGIQTLFIAEVIVHGREVGPGPTADFADGGVAKPSFSKDCPRRVQKALTGFGAGRAF